ncbi:hypothetical protein QY049_04120 [Bradyrhizobium sp. WYCCWR 13022]|uniref:hypothetical protein n=1 Tax=unclassified Bradyrhizobium TaxID=2631580 RepID=UPI00263B73BE|nr:hypothetical protein [Bradyrhizobium sp. WYCCWR 13022]MDN4982410.1 hypothetical protein [Bradyrhizobium sp. WYCCWR 13022]
MAAHEKAQAAKTIFGVCFMMVLRLIRTNLQKLKMLNSTMLDPHQGSEHVAAQAGLAIAVCLSADLDEGAFAWRLSCPWRDTFYAWGQL